jgi:hypothetical protein
MAGQMAAWGPAAARQTWQKEGVQQRCQGTLSTTALACLTQRVCAPGLGLQSRHKGSQAVEAFSYTLPSRHA